MSAHMPFEAPASSPAPSLSLLSAEGKPAVSVEDETTKRCSACSEDRPESEYSSAQLKRKGKRVCQRCVAKRESAASAQQATATQASRKEAMKGAFAAALNSTLPQATPVKCLCCQSKAAVRFVTCVRCTVPCCSLKCFDGHDCDTYLEAKRTMPTVRIPEYDRFASEDELQSSMRTLLTHLYDLSASVSAGAVDECQKDFSALAAMPKLDWQFICQLYAPSVSVPFWAPASCRRLRLPPLEKEYVRLCGCLCILGRQASNIMQTCTFHAKVIANRTESTINMVSGVTRARVTSHLTSACLLPQRLIHKLLTLVIFFARSLPIAWHQAECGSAGQLASDLFGIIPCKTFASLDARMGYRQHVDPRTGVCTLVPLRGNVVASSKYGMLEQHLGHQTLVMVVHRDGTLMMDRGLLLCSSNEGRRLLTAVSGFSGRTEGSFIASPLETHYPSIAWLEETCTENERDTMGMLARQEIENRQRPDYFHIIPAIKRLISKEDWPTQFGEFLFIATPQRGIESDLVELSLLEALVEEAAAGDVQAQLLIAHIEAECSDATTKVTIKQIIAEKRALMQCMIEEQLLIHAEAAERAENKRRIKAVRVSTDDSDSLAAASAARSSSSSRAPASAASSASSSSATQHVSSTGAAASSLVSASVAGSGNAAYSWTSAYSSLESMCEPGRKKYKTIIAAALRFLHTLKPVSVNRSGGSHTVFHFASGKPVTLVTPHGGDGSVSRHATTRLYTTLYEVALQQLNPSEALPASSARAALADA